MRGRTAFGLIVLGAAVLGAALTLRPASDVPPAGSGQLMFPGIADSLTRTARVEIVGNGKAATLVLKDGAWGLAERDGYRITLPKLREVLSGVAELKLIEPRTGDRDQFGKLGVDDPTAVGSTATGLKLRDGAGGVLADLILGHRRVRSQGGLPEAVYVRKPQDSQSWLAEGRIPADSDPQTWLVRELADIPADKIAHVGATRGADTLVFDRNKGKFGLVQPADVKVDDYRVEEVSRALTGLTMNDVRKAALPGAPVGSTVFTTTDGMTLTVMLSKDGARMWGSFAAAGTGAETFAPLAGWAFELADWREKALLPALADMKAAEPAKPDAPAAADATEPPK